MEYYVFEVSGSEVSAVNVFGDCGNDTEAIQRFVYLMRAEYWPHWNREYVLKNDYRKVVCRCKHIGNDWHFMIFDGMLD